MSSLKSLIGALALSLFTLPANAADVMVMDPYFRTSGPTAKSGGAFMHIANHSDADDRLISARSDVAKKIELHTHIDAGNGVMQMRQVKGGFEIPAQGMHMLARGGDHIMFMGLTREVVDGDSITVTLTFEKAGEITIEIPIDQTRMPADGGMQMNHDNNG